MKKLLLNRWELCSLLVIFIVLKLAHLRLAFYWDESYPYVVAIKELFAHGPSLMPSALDSEISKGHPLLFHFLASLWMKIFGTSNCSLHSFSLLISVVLLTTIYEITNALFNKNTAVIALALLLPQTIFFVQSSMVLPEVLLALLALSTLYFYVTNKFVLTTLSLTALFYTKESGIVLGLLCLADAAIMLFRDFTLKNWARLGAIVLPFLFIALFFVAQHRLRGWYFYPEHISFLSLKWKLIFYNFKTKCIHDVFTMGLRHVVFIILLFSILVFSITHKYYKYCVIFLPSAFLYFLTDDMRSGRIMPGIPFTMLFFLSLFFMFYRLLKAGFFANTVQARFSILSVFFIFAFYFFAAINFYTPRYLLITLPLLFIFIALIFDKIMLARKQFYYLIIAASVTINVFAYITDHEIGDTNAGCYNVIGVFQDVADFFEAQNDHDLHIAGSSFLGRESLSDHRTGYLHGTVDFKSVTWTIDSATQFIVFNSIEKDERYRDIIKDPSFHLVKRFVRDNTWCEIYKRQSP